MTSAGELKATVARSAWGVLRAPQWLHFAGLPLAGLDARTLASTQGPSAALGGIAVASGCLGFAYGVNALVERMTDRSSQKNPLAGMARVPRLALLAVVLASLGALLGSALLGPRAFAACSSSLVAGALYSVGPRMKALPGLGLLFNTLIFVPLLALCLDAGAAPSGFWVSLVVFTSLLVQNQLVHEVADTEEDEASGALTTARYLGLGLTRAAAAGSAMLAAVVAVAVAPSLWFGVAGTTVLLAGGVVAAGSGRVLLGAGATHVLSGPSAAERRRAHRLVAAAGGTMLHVVGLIT